MKKVKKRFSRFQTLEGNMVIVGVLLDQGIMVDVDKTRSLFNASSIIS